MKRIFGLSVIVSVFLLWVTGCGAVRETAVLTIQYPALVLFYTDD